MATSYWETSTAEIINSDVRLKERINEKFMARFFHNVPGPATELPSSTNWKTHVITTLDPVPFARIIVFKPPPAETFFGLVRVENSAELLIWDVYDTEEMPATGRYIGLVPPDCVIQLKKVMVKFVDLTSGGSA